MVKTPLCAADRLKDELGRNAIGRLALGVLPMSWSVRFRTYSLNSSLSVMGTDLKPSLTAKFNDQALSAKISPSFSLSKSSTAKNSATNGFSDQSRILVGRPWC